MIKGQPCKSLGIVFQEEGTGCAKAWREESLGSFKGEKKGTCGWTGVDGRRKEGKWVINWASMRCWRPYRSLDFILVVTGSHWKALSRKVVVSWRVRSKTHVCWDFPGSPVIKTLCFQCRGENLILGQGTKIPYAMLGSQKKKKFMAARNLRMWPSLRIESLQI